MIAAHVMPPCFVLSLVVLLANACAMRDTSMRVWQSAVCVTAIAVAAWVRLTTTALAAWVDMYS